MKQGSYRKLDYDVDIVFCIDVTESMGAERMLDNIKQNAVNFYDDFVRAMEEKGKKVRNLRIRIVAFRDYYYDGDEAMLETDFFMMPQQAEDLRACLSCIVAAGGGDDPEDGLEAIAHAIKSDWCNGPGKKRHVIVVWSDEGTHELGFGKSVPNYPKGMAKNFDELTRWWGNANNPGVMDNNAKRLLMFTPDKPGWSNIRECWNNCIHYQSEAGLGLVDVDYKQILEALRNSV